MSINISGSAASPLINARPSPDTIGADTTSLGWVITALGEKARGLGSSITTRSLQYSADILAVSGNGRSFNRVRVVFDNSTGTPQIVYRRDVTDRGWPMDQQILANLRSGQLDFIERLAASDVPQLKSDTRFKIAKITDVNKKSACHPQRSRPTAITPATPATDETSAGIAALTSVTRPKGTDATATAQKKSWGLLR